MKKFIIFLLIASLIIISSCNIGKTCSQECVQEEQYCASPRQECVEKNFWGNCVEFEERCSRYETKCVKYDEVCR